MSSNELFQGTIDHLHFRINLIILYILIIVNIFANKYNQLIDDFFSNIVTENKELTEEIAKELDLPVSPVHVTKFANGEILCEPVDSVREKNVYIGQSTSAPVNDNLFEILIFVSLILIIFIPLKKVSIFKFLSISQNSSRNNEFFKNYKSLFILEIYFSLYK